MSAIRLFTDEDIHSAIATAMRAAGFDAVSTPEVLRRGESDESQLEFAASIGYTILTFNAADFARLHAEYCEQGRTHAGIIVSKQRPIGELLVRLNRLCQILDSEAMQNRIEFLSNW
jgi:hypothetical protein